MKQLFNYYPLNEYEAELASSYGSLGAYLAACSLDGAEVFLPTEYHADIAKHTVGIHLPYLPHWIAFWKGDEARLRGQFDSQEERRAYFSGADSREDWVERVRGSIRRALCYKPEYLVWHVSEADSGEIYTRNFRYTNEDVLCATAELFHCVDDLIPNDIPVLFENLWWPGLTLTDRDEADKFFRMIDRDSAGIMLDTGHLMNTNTALRTEEEAADYILRTVDDLGDIADRIRGMHLQCSLSGDYVTHALKKRPRGLTLEAEMAHIAAIDEHKPFQTDAMRRVIDRMRPDHLVHELYYDNLSHMHTMLTRTQELLGLR